MASAIRVLLTTCLIFAVNTNPLNKDFKEENDSFPLKEYTLSFTSTYYDGTPEYVSSEEIMSEPRRHKRWIKLGYMTWRDMPVTISFKNFLPTISKYDQLQILKECALMFSEVSGISFKIVDKRNCKPSKTRCTHIELRYNYIDGAGNIAGRALSPTPYWVDKPSWAEFDASESWKARSNSSGSGVSLKWAMCHELGHSIALGHSSVIGSVMNGSGRPAHLEHTLHSDDIVGVQSLYGPPNEKTVTVDNFSFTPQPTILPRTATESRSSRMARFRAMMKNRTKQKNAKRN